MGVDMNECIQANSKNWVLDRYWSVLYSRRIQPSTDTHTILPGTVPVLGCNGLHHVCIGSVLYTGWRYKNRYCSVPCFYSWYRTVPFLYQVLTVYQKPAPIRYCPVPCLYRLSDTRYRYTVLDGIGTMCKTVPFGTFPIPCTGNTVSEQYQFLPFNSTGTVPSSTVMFTVMSLYVMLLKWHVYNESNLCNVLVTKVRYIVSVKIHVIRL